MLANLLRISFVGFLLLPLLSQSLAIKTFASSSISHPAANSEYLSFQPVETSHNSASSKKQVSNSSGSIFDTITLPCPEEDCTVNFVIAAKENPSENDLESIVLYQDLLQKTISQIPYSLWQSLEKITFSFDESINRGAASYRQLRLRIVNVTEEEFVAVLIHELGHLTDLGGLIGEKSSGESNFPDGNRVTYNDDPSISFYSRVWASPYQVLSQNQLEINDFISGYSTSDCFEHFAETFLTYVLHGELLERRNIEQYEYFRDQVFAGIEYQEFTKLEDFNQYFFDATLLPYDFAKFIES